MGSTPELITELESFQATLSAAHQHDRERRGAPASTARWWWEFHQAAMSLMYVLMMYPAWRVRSWLDPPWGTLFLLATLVCAATSITLRLHLWFTSRFSPSELSTERWKARIWTRWADGGMTAALLVATLRLGVDHQAISMLFVTVAISGALASFIIEPATARATFGS
jgi:hypothetical protein